MSKHWPTLVAWPEETYLETVQASDHATATTVAERIYQGAVSIEVITTAISHPITAPDPQASAEPVKVLRPDLGTALRGHNQQKRDGALASFTNRRPAFTVNDDH